MYPGRYIFDVMYGPIAFSDFVWQASVCPELQRLREVRMCNINSLCLTGGANINRYEHSVGTAHLANMCVETWPTRLDSDTKRRIILAALLHDIGSTAFGHSVQYVLDDKGYQHDSLFGVLSLSGDGVAQEYVYQHARLQPIYFGMPKRLTQLIPENDLRSIGDMIAGKGRYGPLISGTVDLDNIDNVFRLAYHIGLTSDRETPLELAKAIYINDDQLTIRKDAVSYLQNWYEVRRLLYHFLLLNPDEFSAKCMLEEALELAQARSSIAFNWHDVDYQLVDKLSSCSADVSSIIARLMLGDVYGCLGIYSTSELHVLETVGNRQIRHAIEKELGVYLRGLKIPGLKSPVPAIHVIKDVNKTQRQIHVHTSEGERVVIGNPSKRVLIGVFLKNIHQGMTQIKPEILVDGRIRRTVRQWLTDKLTDSNIEELQPYGELHDTIFQSSGSHRHSTSETNLS